MSIQAIAAVLDTDVGESSAKMLLVSIANAHNGSSGICCPSIDRLAAESSMSRSTVKRWLRWLEEHRFLKREDRRDASGRQQSYGFVLTLSEGSKMNPSPADDLQDVEGPNLDRREVTGEPEEGFTVEPPLKKPEEKPSPQPPASGGLDFTELVKAWPQEHRGNLENAQGAFGRLGASERAAAIRSAPTAISAFARRKARIPALSAYIRSRVFAEFDGGPPIDPDGLFIIKPDRPEWSAWLGWIRKSYGAKALEDTVKRGYFLPQQRWPDGHVAKEIA